MERTKEQLVRLAVAMKEYLVRTRQFRPTILYLLIAALGAGCHIGTTGPAEETDGRQQMRFALEIISQEKGQAYLSELGLGDVILQTNNNTLLVSGSSDDIRKAQIVLELVDGEDDYVIETLVPVSAARNIPTNKQIAEILGSITIGTFTNPPLPNKHERAIIDIYGDSVVAVMPARFRQEIVALVKSGAEGLELIRLSTSFRDRDDDANYVSAEKQPQEDTIQIESTTDLETPICFDANSPTVSAISEDRLARSNSSQSLPKPQEFVESTQEAQITSQAQPDVAVTRTIHVNESHANRQDSTISRTEGDNQAKGNPVTLDITVPSSTKITSPSIPGSTYKLETLDNANDKLVLNLPEELDMALLLDVAAQYLHLDYMYDLTKIKGQKVTLKLRGKLEGEITVKELYPLLESIMKFKGFVMTRQEGNLVTVVPVEEVLEVDPMLVDPNDRTIKAGDMVVTRMFELKNVEALSAVNLLESMRLTLSVSPVSETQTLIITGYAHRMARIEKLLAMIDRPGKLRKVRFRQLQYITANMLAEKVKTLATELQTVGVTITQALQTSLQSGDTSPRLATAQIDQYLAKQRANRPAGVMVSERQTVYLDADDRTNRILIIGYEEQLNTVEELVDAFDVPQKALRMLQVYELGQVEAKGVKDKLQELGMISKTAPREKSSPTPPKAQPSPPFAAGEPPQSGGPLVEEPRVVVLEATNALLVDATREQHAQIAEIISYADKVQQDLRTLKVYEIKHIEAKEARRKLAELKICGVAESASGFESAVPKEATTKTTKTSILPPSPDSEVADTSSPALFMEPQVVVVESTNSLLVNATIKQHELIETALGHVDNQTREGEIPYKVYPLKNSPPSHLAEVLEKLIQETVQDKEGKIEKIIKREEEIAIVPDPNTYSLIVYASRKNQEWIASLIKQLDKRRPQVLIDVTLVEITKSDVFNYDLDVIRSWQDLDDTSGITGVGVEPNFMGTLVQTVGGSLTAFYGDEQIQALLVAMQSKNYGRVLAKPKLLVNDNQAGTIKATDTTYVETKSGIPVSSGAVGNQQNFVETSLQYEPYEAGITLDITPHISEGNMLRLEISLTRSDFLKTITEGKPPNTTANEVQTDVTIPDGSTIILGGLIKLNQIKGGSKVPILGDIPLIGGLFRSVSNEDEQSKLYVFVKAEIMRPGDTIDPDMKDLEAVSERNRRAFEKYEEEFQSYEDWPGFESKPVDPPKVLDDQ